MSEALTLRPANIADLATLQHWDEQQHVLDSDPNDDWNWETELLRNPEWRMQLMAEWAGRPVGFMQIIDPALEKTHYWGDVPPSLRAIDIWIGAPEDLGKLGEYNDHCFVYRLERGDWSRGELLSHAIFFPKNKICV